MDYKIGLICTMMIVLCNAFPDGAPPDTCMLSDKNNFLGFLILSIFKSIFLTK